MPDDPKPYDPEDDKPLTDRQPEIVDKYHARVRDHELYELANPLIDRDGAGTGLNLLVGGSIVSGKVCSAYEWANALDDLSRRLTGKPRQEFEQTGTFENWSLDFIGLRQAHDQAWNKRGRELTDADYEARFTYLDYIHLLDAYVFMGTATAPPNGQPYRVRIDQIQAWGLGTLSREQ